MYTFHNLLFPYIEIKLLIFSKQKHQSYKSLMFKRNMCYIKLSIPNEICLLEHKISDSH
jgi:hypothetical protein